MLYKQYICGRMVDGEGVPFDVINPKNGEVAGTVGTASAAQVTQALEAAQKAFPIWSRTPIQTRIDYLEKLKAAVMKRKDQIINTLFNESGKTIMDATFDFMNIPARIDYYVQEMLRVYGTTLPEYRHDIGYCFTAVEKKPRGVVVAHLAWNAPLGGVGFRAASAMMAGCPVIIKPSSETPLSTLLIGEAAEEAGIPEGVLSIVHGPSSIVGKTLNESTIPAMITLVGSAETGLKVMQEGSTSIKYYSLELGGNCPVIVMPDADLDEAAKGTVGIKTLSSGQICSGYNRIYVHESVYEQYLEKVVAAITKVPVTMGETPGPGMSSMINFKARDRMFELIDEAVKGGATLLCGGDIPKGLEKGAFINPAVLKDVKDDMRVCREEIFGPIVAVQPYSDFDDVLKRAVDTNYGLTSYLFGHDSRAIGKACEYFESGEVVINATDVNGIQFPHPGWKASGLGCAYGTWSLEEYFRIKRITIKL